MLHVLSAESVAGQAAEDDHADKRWDLNFRHARLEIDWADLSALEVDAFHKDLDEDTSDRAHECHNN